MRRLVAGVAIGLAAAAVVLLPGRAGLFETLELKTYDWRVGVLADLRIARQQPLGHPDIALVEINDASIRDLAEIAGRWPWPRALSAMLVDYLARGEPRVIAIDIGFWERERDGTYTFLDEEWTGARSDQALADAVRRAGNVILLADAVNPGLAGAAVVQKPWPAPPYRLGPRIEERPVITLPYDSLAAAAAGFGHNFLALDPDGPARRIPPFVRNGDRYMPTLGLAAALAAEGHAPADVVLDEESIRVRDREIPLVRVPVADPVDPARTHDQLTMMINYRAPSHVRGERPYAAYEVLQLLQSEEQIRMGGEPAVAPGVFKDKIVFVGLTASGLLDAFPTPFGEGVFPGIQLHANVADSVLSNRFVRPGPGWSAVGAVAVGAVVTGLMSAAWPFAAASGGTVALALLWTGASVYAFDRGLWLALAQPLLALATALFGGTAYRYFVEGAERRKVSRLFGRYVSRDVYTQLMENPGLAELGGARREMSVLFSDIRGFTSVTERGSPEVLVQQLNEYFSRMVEIVFRHRGTVDKFVGDMVMALFAAPIDDPEHADHAVGAAVAMVRELGELNRKWAAEGRPMLDIGVGVNSGEMIAGNIGSSAIMSYTVIGDNVNLGARLESLNKDYGTRVIISDATRNRLKGSYDLRPLGDVVVKGKTQPVAIHEVCVPSPLASEQGVAARTAPGEKAL